MDRFEVDRFVKHIILMLYYNMSSARGYMSVYTERYFGSICEIFSGIISDPDGSIRKAAEMMADAIMQDKLIHVIGTGGHSNLGAEELFWRAGGLVPINAILDPGTSLIHGAIRSNIVERSSGYAKSVLDAYGIFDGVIVIVNAYGINSMTIEVAMEARKRGVPTIGVTSRSFGDNVPENHPARHMSGQNLFEIVDVWVDCHMPYGDAIVDFPGLTQKVGPSSTMANCFTVNLLVVETVNCLLERGCTPPLWQSANLPGGDQANSAYQEAYKGRVKHLY